MNHILHLIIVHSLIQQQFNLISMRHNPASLNTTDQPLKLLNESVTIASNKVKEQGEGTR